MAQNALGRLVNCGVAIGDNVYVNLKDAGGVLFLCYLTGAAGDTYTLTEATTAAGGSAQVLACITRYHTCTGDGTDTWTLRTQAAGSTMVTAAAATQNCAVLEVRAEQLSASFKYLKLASTGAGLITPITFDLAYQRTPANLPAMGV
jgi:hypothetical protein